MLVKEPICCSVKVDISVVCQAVYHVLMHCFGSFDCTIFAFDGQTVENKNFSVKCCLLAFNIVVYVASYHAYHIYPRPFFFFRDAVALLRESYTPL